MTAEHRDALTRRGLFAAAGAGALAAACSAGSSKVAIGAADAADGDRRGRTALTVRGRMVVSKPLRLTTLTIAPGGELVLAPDRDVTVDCTGNVTVEGRLTMRPRDGVTHLVRFSHVQEQRFVGGGMSVLDTDVGLWVVGRGQLDVSAPVRTAWVRAAADVPSGTRTLTLEVAPTGWRVGDEVVLTPTVPPGTEGFYDAYDTARVTHVSGRVVTLDQAVRHDHPRVAVGGGLVLGCEVLNLTRGARIEGTPGGRAHVFILSRRAQHIAGLAIRHMAPRNAGGGILGRYGLHFHMCNDGSRGSRVDGVVIRDCGNHAFVAHQSHGVTFTGCISHDTVDDAYWWDQAPNTRELGPPTDDARYVRCVASRVVPGDGRGYRMTGFNLSTGTGNVVRGCVATGVQGIRDSSGFEWPESGSGTWGFDRNVAHNNQNHGLFVWQNSKLPHVITRFAGYHNGQGGISHGAYRNNYDFRNSLLFGNGAAGVVVHAGSAHEPLRFSALLIDGAGIAPYGMEVVKHTLAPDQPTLVTGCTMAGHTRAAIGFTVDGETQTDLMDVVGCSLAQPEFALSNSITADSLIRVQDATTAFALRRADQSGRFNPDWNARETDIAHFSDAAAAFLPFSVPMGA